MVSDAVLDGHRWQLYQVASNQSLIQELSSSCLPGGNFQIKRFHKYIHSRFWFDIDEMPLNLMLKYEKI